MRWILLMLCALAAGCATVTVSGPTGRARIVDAETGAPVGKAAVAALIVARVQCSQIHLEGEECEHTFQKLDLRTDSEGYVTVPAWGPVDVGTQAKPDALYPRLYVYVPGNVYMAGFPAIKCYGRCGDVRADQAWFDGQNLTLLKLKQLNRQYMGLEFVSGPGRGKCEWLELANWTAAALIDRERAYIPKTIKALEAVEHMENYWSAKMRAATAARLQALRAGNLTYEERFGSAKELYDFDPAACPDGLRILDERMEYFRTP
jgi:hypothetical protein